MINKTSPDRYTRKLESDNKILGSQVKEQQKLQQETSENHQKLLDQLQRKDQQIQSLLSENEKVFAAFEQYRKEHSQTIKSGVNQKQVDEDVIIKSKREIMDLKSLIAQLKSEIDVKDTEQRQFKDKIFQLEKTHLAQQSKEFLVEKRRQEIDNLTRSLNDQQNKVTEAQQQITKLMEDNVALQRQIDTHARQSKELKNVIKNIEQTHKDQITKLNHIHSQQIENLIKQNKQEVEQVLNTEKTRAQDMGKKMTDVLAEETQSLINEIRQEREINHELKREINKIKLQTYKSVQGEVDELQSVFEDFQKEKVRCADQVKLLEDKSKKQSQKHSQEKKELQNTIEELKSQNTHLIEELEKIQPEVQLIPKLKQQQLSLTQQQLDSTKKSCQSENQIKKLQDQIQKLNEQLVEKNKYLQSLKSELSTQTNEHNYQIQQIKLETAQEIRTIQDQFKTDLSEQKKLFNLSQKPVQEQLRTAAVDNQIHLQNIQKQQQQISNLQHRVEELLANMDDQNQAIYQLNQSLKDNQKHDQTLQNQIKSKEKEIQSLQQKIQQQKDKLKEQSKQAKQVHVLIESMRLEIANQGLQINQLGKENQELTQELSKSHQESRVLKNQLTRK